MQWAQQHKNWSVQQWSKVLFTDESKFEVFGSHRRMFVRRRRGERMKSQCVTPTVKHGGGSVMVWGCFAGDKVGDLVRINGTLKKEGYHRILINNAVPSGKRLIGRGFVLQQDNDPKHSSKLCRGYVNRKEKCGELKNMIWPSQSPDLNPIELLWDELDREVRKLRSSNVEELWNNLQSCWTAISAQTLQNLISRMPRVCAAVLRAKGGYFEEAKI